MIYLVSSFPNYCADCGHHIDGINVPRSTMQDFNALSSFTCESCGSQYQKLCNDMLNVLDENDLLDPALNADNL